MKHKSLVEEKLISETGIENMKKSNFKLDKIDFVIMCVMTLIYLLIALYNLGSTKVPETSWKPASTGESVILDLNKRADISRIYYYKGLGQGKIRLEYQNDKGEFIPLTKIDLVDDYIWKYAAVSIKTEKIKIIIDKPGFSLNEIGVFENNNKTPLSIKLSDKNISINDNGSVKNIIDEQNVIDYDHTFLTGFYFDEIYHAKTAYEQLHHMEPTETTHPPLGKILISIGIMIFGMNGFGWRIIGTLFGAAMIPLMYAFGKKIFFERFYAFCAAFLMMFDFMHFTQTRIATIDVYGTFFVIIMYYYMFDYFVKKSYETGFKESLKPLFLSGLFFGLGAASKWIALYGAGGLALLFFCQKYFEYKDYKIALHKKNKPYWIYDFVPDYIGKTFLWCVLFFIIIPAVIYYLSYIPYMMVKGAHHGLKDIINYQVFMYDYHKNLVADHFFKSKWYTWPFDYKPIWFYSGSDLPHGIASSITSMGNPAVWWAGIITVPASLILAFKKRDKKMAVVFIAIAFQYLPWVFISRLTFIYHYFSTVPFVILTTIYVIKYVVEKKPSVKGFVYGYLVVVLILFIAFYPVLSGMEVPKAYIDNYLRWFKGSWYF